MKETSIGTNLYTVSDVDSSVLIALCDSSGWAMQAVQSSGLVPSVSAGIFGNGCVIVVQETGASFVNTAADGLAPSWSAQGTVTAKVSLTSAQILALNTTPVTLVAAPGAGWIIQPVSVIGKIAFATAAYATNTTLNVGIAGASDALLTNTSLLPVTAGTVYQPFFGIAQASVTGNDNEFVANAALTVSAATGNPTAGAGTMSLYVTYKLIQL